MTETKRDTAAGPNGSALSDLLGLAVMLPACWAWQDINGDRQVNWYCKPDGAHEPLYRGAALERVLAHARGVHEFNEQLYGRNEALMLAVSDMSAVMVRMVAGIEHLAEIARRWEPDHSSGADRRGWLLAQDAKDDAKRLLAAIPSRISGDSEAAKREAALDELRRQGSGSGNMWAHLAGEA